LFELEFEDSRAFDEEGDFADGADFLLTPPLLLPLMLPLALPLAPLAWSFFFFLEK